MSKDTDYTNVLLEDMRDDIKLILEVLMPMRKEVADIKEKVDELPQIKDDIAVIKVAVKDTNIRAEQDRQRITNLELAIKN